MIYEQLIGKTIKSIEQTSDTISFVFDDDTAALWYHEQDCCESVGIDDVNGDWNDLIGVPLLIAEERDGETGEDKDYDYSYTWTFYTFRSIHGSVDVKWFGTSNGYYSESVNFLYPYNSNESTYEQRWN